jgi:hypothetical protein
MNDNGANEMCGAALILGALIDGTATVIDGTPTLIDGPDRLADGLTLGTVRAKSFLDLSSALHPRNPNNNGIASSATSQPGPGDCR